MSEQKKKQLRKRLCLKYKKTNSLHFNNQNFALCINDARQNVG